MSRKYFFPPNPVVPTRVTNKRWIYALCPDVYRIEEEWICEDEDQILSESDEDSDESDDEVESTTSGKWMLFFDSTHENVSRGMTHHDYVWQFIKRLVENKGKEIGMRSAKCSTGWSNHRNPTKQVGDRNGVICCYTQNYFNKADVKRVADSIREVVDYPRDMFYKTDNATRAGNYRCLGKKHVSIYKHTTECHMFERDQRVQYYWNRVNV